MNYNNGTGNIPRLPDRVVDTLIDAAGVSRCAPGRTATTVRDQSAEVERLVHDACEELLARLPAAPAPSSHQDAAELAEWRRLKDPAVLHASLLRGLPAKLPDYVFRHIAGDAAPAGEPVDVTKLPVHPSLSRWGHDWSYTEQAAIAVFGAQQRQEGRRDMHETNIVLLGENCKLAERLAALTAPPSTPANPPSGAREVQGWQLVPIRPTAAMIDAAADADPERESVWAAYLAAAPTLPEAPEPAAFCTDGGTPLATYAPPKLEHDWEAEPAQQGAWKWASFEDWLASPITPPSSHAGYVRQAFSAGRASQGSSQLPATTPQEPEQPR